TMTCSSSSRIATRMAHATSWHRPPLWLAAAAVAAGWGAAYTVARWTLSFVLFPVHEDVRIFYVAAEAGVRHGWSTIYDLGLARTLSAAFPAGERHIDSWAAFSNPPLLAWLFVPLTVVPEPVAYGVWTLISFGALLWTWYLVAPYSGLAKTTLLLLALALWPVLASFYFGQPAMVLLALVATAWWLCAHDRPLTAGFALALATFLKPHLVVLIPLALLASARYRPFVGWVAACAVLGVVTILALGPAGLISWWHVLSYLEGDVSNRYYTLAGPLGLGPLTYCLWAAQGGASLLIAWRRRSELDIVFAAGVLGSLAMAFYLHQADYSNLLLAAWFVLRTAPPIWHRLWLLAGVVTMQALTVVSPAPQLMWDAAWLAILLVSSFAGSGASALATRSAVASAGRADT
ncbi:MAG: DUF2029 domain-containing protein, partial [Candidatus Dormibacteraeota bacterium]|nr:DUF2029 domain-containing protein [Candidatus Dormibacteraeota bacterium]